MENRIIKFRGLDIDRKEWVYGYFYTFGERAFIIEPGKPGIPEQHIRVALESVGQFTGLLDKNGKEIYEGDILQAWEVIDFDTGIGIDSRDVETRKFAVDWDKDVCGWNLYGATKFEVIGNVFENPELLK